MELEERDEKISNSDSRNYTGRIVGVLNEFITFIFNKIF